MIIVVGSQLISWVYSYLPLFSNLWVQVIHHHCVARNSSVATHYPQDKDQNSEQGPQGSVWTGLCLPSQPCFLPSSPMHLPWLLRHRNQSAPSSTVQGRSPCLPSPTKARSLIHIITTLFLPLGMSQLIIAHLYVKIWLMFLFLWTMGYSSTQLVFSDEMARWHHWLDGRESEWTLGVGDGQGGLACCDSLGCKESDTTEQLNWTERPLVCQSCSSIMAHSRHSRNID